MDSYSAINMKFFSNMELKEMLKYYKTIVCHTLFCSGIPTVALLAFTLPLVTTVCLVTDTHNKKMLHNHKQLILATYGYRKP